MPKRQRSRCMWYPTSFITMGTSAQDWPPSLGWRQSLVATANWPTWRRSGHPCEFLTLQGGASPGAKRACLLLWSRLASKRWLWPCSLCGRQERDDSLPWQMAGMCSCANKNFLLDHQKAFISLLGTGPCRILLLGLGLQHLGFIVSWPVLKQEIWKEMLFQKS